MPHPAVRCMRGAAWAAGLCLVGLWTACAEEPPRSNKPDIEIVVPGARPHPGPTEPENEVICRVNTESISKKDIEENMDMAFLARLNNWRDQVTAQGKWDKAAEKQYYELYMQPFEDALRNLVRARLMLAEAKAQKLEVDKERFKKAWEEWMERVRKAGGLPKGGLTLADYKSRLRDQLLTEAFAESLVSRLDWPNRTEIENYYKEHTQEFLRKPGVKVRLLKINTHRKNAFGGEDPVPDALEVINGLRHEVADLGHSFADLARERSDDEESRKREGLLGTDSDPYIDPAPATPVGRAVSRGLKIGDLSNVFRYSDKSWAFVCLEGRREASPRPLDDELRQQIRQFLWDRLRKKREDDWFRQALKRNYIGRFDDQPYPVRFFFPADPPEKDSAAEKPKP